MHEAVTPARPAWIDDGGRPGTVPLAVIGVGASATFLLSALARTLGELPRIVLVEKERCPGPGVAYRTADPELRMNVRACQLTAVADQADHFTRWAAGVVPGTQADDYVPRALYGRYLREVLDAATASPSPVVRIRAEVVAVEPEADGVRVLGTDGELVRAERAVLALGVPPTAAARFVIAPEVRAAGRMVDDPWGPEGLEPLAGARRVVIVGTGLTMVDVALTLLGRLGVREVLAVSPSGALPAAHPVVRRVAERAVEGPPLGTAAEVVRWVRTTVADEPAGWAAALDAIRWEANGIWAGLPVDEQVRLLRLTRSRWSRLRHRMPPEVAARLHEARDRGRLRLCAGRVESVERGVDGAVVRVRRRAAHDLRLDADGVVNAAGAPGVWSSPDPVVRALIDGNRVGVDPHGQGLAVGSDGTALAPDGTPVPGLSVLGALRRGSELEATAVPELRAQASALADHLCQRFAAT
jgi:uncharacterized NAD(P)/FAD-binding protein YdhS